MNELLVLTTIVMLPLVPAFILFKLLPSRAVVKGPLAGLDVSLGGAFGGYVALTVFVATFFAHSIDKPTALHVHGSLQFPDGERPPVVTCDVHPPAFRTVGARDFELDMDDGRMPVLVFSADGYDSVPVYLDKVPKKPENGRIEIPDVVFRKSPPYKPAQPVQVAEGGKS
jgi:hypothetical protein